jgi:DNA-binding MarR family transcriptional regulator
MSGRLQREIGQRRPFANLEEEVFLNLQRSAEVLTRRLTEVMKPAELTPTQYNVLRILRGAEPDGLPCREIGARMVTHDSDVTRLLDRLGARGLVTRSRGERDRRVVSTRITDEGLRLVATLDEGVRDFMARELGHIGRERLRTLGELLEEVRGPE